MIEIITSTDRVNQLARKINKNLGTKLNKKGRVAEFIAEKNHYSVKIFIIVTAAMS